jgi:hypothetical protein
MNILVVFQMIVSLHLIVLESELDALTRRRFLHRRITDLEKEGLQ